MKNIKLLFILFWAILTSEIKAQSTDFEKIAVGGKAEYSKLNISENSPLIIINGIELPKKSIVLNKINSNDIEKLDILKNEKARDKYGNKAIDGVIVITLKKDKLKKYKKLLKSTANNEETTSEFTFDKNQYNLVLTGVIKDDNNQNIPKAVVTNLTKKETYYSDSLGNYKINIAKNDYINFSKNGFESQKIRIKVDTILNVILKIQTTPDAIMIKKPLIYLYPTQKTDIILSINFKGKLLTTFPQYEGKWNVTAYPDGKIFDKKSQRFYNSLFWDGTQNFPMEHYKYKSGFVVSKNDLTDFLIEKLEYLGLNNSETNDFVQYWLPILEKNETNFIHFYVNDDYDVISKNNISPKPDTSIRIFMEFYGLDKSIEISEQILSKTERKGFTLVEWGGSDVSEVVKELNALKL